MAEPIPTEPQRNISNIGIKEDTVFIFFSSFYLGRESYFCLQRALAGNRNRWDDSFFINSAIFQEMLLAGAKDGKLQPTEDWLCTIQIVPNYDRQHPLLMVDNDLQQVSVADGKEHTVWSFEEFCALDEAFLRNVNSDWDGSSPEESFGHRSSELEPAMCWEKLTKSMSL